jgi:CBS domain-containing protein
MFGSLRNKDRDKPGVLAARQAVSKAQHPRVAEPTAQSVLTSLGQYDVPRVGEDATVFDALKVMAERDAAAIAVTSPAGLVGIFSERDFARSGLVREGAARETPVVEVMTRVVAGVAPADSVRRCLILMNERRVAHVAVLNEGRPIGLLSETELLAARIAYHERVFYEAEMDQKLLFLRGTYSC